MLTRKPFPTAVLVVTALIVSAACRPTQTVQRQTDDAGITAVEVNVTNGVVTLAGPVASEQEKQKIEAAARSVEGVVSVTSNLQVTAAPATSPQPATSSAPASAPSPPSGNKPLYVPFPTPTRAP